jgi:hypothetical protein
MSKNKKKNTTAERQTTEVPRKKDIGDYILYGWVVLLIAAGILMAYKFLHG